LRNFKIIIPMRENNMIAILKENMIITLKGIIILFGNIFTIKQ